MRGRPVVDLTGKEFGELTVIRREESITEMNGKRRTVFLVRCSCGKDKVVLSTLLTRKLNPIRSCGCQKEKGSYSSTFKSDLQKTVQERYEQEGSVPLSREFGVHRSYILKIATKLGLQYKDRYKHHSTKVKAANKSCNHDYFETWSANMAYCLGYIYADGHINKTMTTLGLRCHSKDEEILLAIHKELDSKHNIGRTPARFYSGRNNGPQTYCNISSMRLVESLMRHGVRPGKSSLDLPMPEVPDEYFWHFFRGYFDGDGHVSSKKNRSYSYSGRLSFVATKTFAEQMMDRACRSIRHLPRSVRQQGKIYAVEWSHFTELCALYDKMYPEGSYIFLKRKHDVLKNFIKN